MWSTSESTKFLAKAEGIRSGAAVHNTLGNARTHNRRDADRRHHARLIMAYILKVRTSAGVGKTAQVATIFLLDISGLHAWKISAGQATNVHQNSSEDTD